MDAPATLLSDSACYSCLGLPFAATLRIASLARLASNTGAPDFTSELLDLDTPSINSSGHGFGKVPSMVRGVLVCIANDPNWAMVPGDELDCFFVWNPTNGYFNFELESNATTITAWNKSAQLGNEGDCYLSGSGNNPTSFNNFKFRFYAWK